MIILNLMEMNVNNIYKYIFLIISFIFFSCKEKQKTSILIEENTYQIFEKIIGDLRESIVLKPGFPPPPDKKNYKFTTKDSLQAYKYFYKQTVRKKIIALLPQTYILNKKYKKEVLKTIKECTNNKNLINSFFNSKKNIKIVIDKIANHKKDSLLYYTKNYEKRLRTEFQDIDIFLSFSNIIFNEEKTKAFLIVGVSYENLNGFSTLIYLEKEYYHWTIKCKKILSIS
ncbi:hypothetical protein [uncultured Tenacibaculum sp.]|uniref:hypothetical protein n=1 Tax=uncultured Tenacibaculum sp. TaxID=174713 RepID=UPI00262A617D|nr:hypothetical protein [uncultured Tenacibaculum sp.]